MTAFFATIGQVLLGWYLADLAGGLFHWFIDHHANPTFWLTRATVKDFREHHNNRLSMENYSRWPSLLLGLVFALPLCALVALGGFWPLAITLLIGAAFTQHAHYYAHSVTKAPYWLLLLQQAGLSMSPATHERHHSDFHRSYGVLNGWSHGTLDLILGRRY